MPGRAVPSWTLSRPLHLATGACTSRIALKVSRCQIDDPSEQLKDENEIRILRIGLLCGTYVLHERYISSTFLDKAGMAHSNPAGHVDEVGGR